MDLIFIDALLTPLKIIIKIVFLDLTVSYKV